MRSETEPISAPAIYSHTSLRGIAALYVVIFHFLNPYDWNSLNEFCKFFRFGRQAVDLFFILSGFILNYVYLDRQLSVNWPSYLVARVARILPLYFLTSFLFISPVHVYSLIRHGSAFVGTDFAVDFLANFFMISGFTTGIERTFNAPAWSIGVEFFCYLVVFPLLVWSNRILVTKRYRVPAFALLAALFTQLGIVHYDAATIQIGRWHWENVRFLTHGIFGFSVGFFLCSLYRQSSNWKKSAVIANLTVFGAITVFIMERFDLVPRLSILYVLPFLVFFKASDRGAVSRFFKFRLFQWLGERSYSIYLWHIPCQRVTNPLRAHLTDFWYYMLVMSLIFLISEFSYRYFECPSRELIRRHARRRNLVCTPT